MQQKKSKWRLFTIAITVSVLWVIVIGRLFYIQAIDGGTYLSKANNQQSRKFEIPALRGLVYVKENQQLYPIALNTQVYTVAVDPKYVKDSKKTTEALEEFVKLPKDQIEQKITGSGRYVELQKQLSYDDAQKLKDMKIPGVILQQRQGRYYPENELFSHVIGYVNTDSNGQYGFEQFANDRLGGTPGLLKTTTDSLGVPISSVENIAQEPKNGQSYVLTLDRGLQAIAAQALKDAVEGNRAESGSIIIMDPKDGAIKALVNYPTFDPNKFSEVKDYGVFQNRAVSHLFEPGSGFKVFTMAAGLNTGKVTPQTKFDDTGEFTVSGKTVKNAENHKFGIQTMTDVIQKSLNTGVIFVLRSLGTNPQKITLEGKQVLADYFSAFGFDKITGIEQAAEVSGRIKDPKTYDIDYANMSFGQGISINSIQMVAAAGVIANGGTLYQPHIVEGKLSANNEIIKEKNDYKVREGVISSESAAQLREMMTQVVEHGSGYATKIKGYAVAGKTGTAQVPRVDGKGYEETKNIGSFIGFAPANDPKFVMFVRIDYPRVDGFAEKTAVPAFGVVAKELMRYYAIPPNP